MSESPQMKGYLRKVLIKTLREWKRKHKGKFPADGYMTPILNFTTKAGNHYQSEIVHDKRYPHPKFVTVCVYRNWDHNPAERLCVNL